MKTLLLIIECAAGFLAGILLVMIIAFVIAFLRTKAGVSDECKGSFDYDRACVYNEKLKKLADGEVLGTLLPMIGNELVEFKAEDSSFLVWQGGYEYIKPIFLKSFSSSVNDLICMIAADELLSEGFIPGPDVFFAEACSDKVIKKGPSKCGNGFSHDITEGMNAVCLGMSHYCEKQIHKVLLQNLWFSKYIFICMGKTGVLRFFSGIIDDIGRTSSEVALATAVDFYKELIIMQKNN